MKKKQSKGATVTTPVHALSREESIQHYNAVLIEHMNSKFDLVMEGLAATRQELKNEINSLRDYVDGRFDVVEAAIRVNAQGIKELRGDVNQLKIDVNQLKIDVSQLKVTMNQVVNSVDAHDDRIERLENIN